MRLAKIKFSQVAAVLAVIGLVFWAMTANVHSAQDKAPEATDQSEVKAELLTRVETRLIQAEDYSQQRVVQGQIEAWRSVDLRTQVSGTVEAMPVALGSEVIEGQALLQLSNAEYRSQIHSTEAAVKLKRAELAAAKRLQKRNLQTETEVLRLTSELEAAKVNLVQARLDLKHAAPSAPFNGVLDQNNAELGQYLSSGDVWARLVNIEKLKVTAQVPQQSVAAVAVGQKVEVALLDGRTFEGVVTFIASAAESSTRSFPIEVLVENPQKLRIAGASATLNINLGSVKAHKISPALLSLNDHGQLGVKWIDQSDNVVFQTVKLLSTGTDGAWIGGLPDHVEVITLGGGFVEHGQQVNPAMAVNTPAVNSGVN